MTREIIEINEELCDGCGDCVVGCSEGAIRIVDGKAKLVKEEFCDGFGDCVGVCPTGALTVIKRDAPAFDDAATRRHLLETQGIDAVRRYEMAQARHEDVHAEHAHGGGCPGSAQRDRRQEVHIPVMQAQSAQAQSAQAQSAQAQPARSQGHPGAISGGCPGSAAREIRRNAAPAPNPVAAASLIPSELGQWPVQLHLVQPGASFFRDREMLVMSTCGPIASAEVHQRYLRNRSVVVACPKLDNTEPYAQKLAAIFQESSIPKVVVVIMEVPCCRGLSMIVQQAHAMSGRTDLVVEEHTLTLDGEIKDVREIAG